MATVVKYTVFLLSALVPSAMSFAAETQRCSTQSIAHRPLIELFTSEGCSSCPPAERWLNAQKAAVAEGRLSAIAWHVDYWDHLGWSDPFSITQASPRQRSLASRSRAQVYTPGMFLNGREWRGWRENQLAGSAPMQVPRLALSVAVTERVVKIASDVEQLGQDAELFWVLQLLDRSSEVRSGENAGKRLQHDFAAQAVQTNAVPANTARQSFSIEMARPEGAIALTAFLQNHQGKTLQSAQLLLTDCH